MSEVFYDFLQKHFSRVLRTALYVYSGAFPYWFLAKRSFFFWFSTLPAYNYPRFVGKFLATLSKMQTGCPGEQFAGKYSLKNYKVFHHIRILSGNFSYFWQEKFGRLAKNAIWVSRRTFWGQTSIEKIYMFILIVFGLRGIFLRTLKETLQYGCPHCSLFVQERSMSRIFFGIFEFLVKNLGFLQNNFSEESSYLQSWYPEEGTEEK